MSNAPTPPPKRRRRWLLRLLIVFIVLGVGAELFARYKLGLGDPPLVMTDPDIEYLFQPSKTYHRFGNVVSINQWSMRCDDFPAKRSDPNELRVLLLGDSVTFGGTQTDQAAIASEIIKRDLPARVGDRPVVVGNISAGSWGPQNLLAYIRKFGLFDADAVILVLSSHDWNDVPSFGPLPADMPTRKPVLAIEEVLSRYVPQWFDSVLPRSEPLHLSPPAAPDDAGVIESLNAVRELLDLAVRSGAWVAIAQHLQSDETMDDLEPGHAAINSVAREKGVGVIQLGPSFEQARRSTGQPYMDIIHPNELGQQIIARTLMDWIIAQVRESQVEPASTKPD